MITVEEIQQALDQVIEHRDRLQEELDEARRSRKGGGEGPATTAERDELREQSIAFEQEAVDALRQVRDLKEVLRCVKEEKEVASLNRVKWYNKTMVVEAKLNEAYENVVQARATAAKEQASAEDAHRDAAAAEAHVEQLKARLDDAVVNAHAALEGKTAEVARLTRAYNDQSAGLEGEQGLKEFHRARSIELGKKLDDAHRDVAAAENAEKAERHKADQAVLREHETAEKLWACEAERDALMVRVQALIEHRGRLQDERDALLVRAQELIEERWQLQDDHDALRQEYQQYQEDARVDKRHAAEAVDYKTRCILAAHLWRRDILASLTDEHLAGHAQYWADQWQHAERYRVDK